MCCVGNYYMQGLCVEQNYKKAFQWFEKAAGEEIPAAQYNLAILYQYGCGVEKDEEKAALWMAKAAQRNFPLAVQALSGEKKEL